MPSQADERAWRSETIGVAARKMSEHFCARRYPQIGFLVCFGFITKSATFLGKLANTNFVCANTN